MRAKYTHYLRNYRRAYLRSDKFDRKKRENLQVLFALMSLGGKSDRAISKVLGVNNTTLSRRRRILEKEGYINEYTAIPDFHKIGLDIIVFTFASTTEPITQIQTKTFGELMRNRHDVLCVLEDQGFGTTNWVIISAHTNHDEYDEMSKELFSQVSTSIRPHMELTSLIFRTNKKHPKMFSLRDVETILKKQSTSKSQEFHEAIEP